MSSDEEKPMKRKRRRPAKLNDDWLTDVKIKTEEEMDGIHYACSVCDQIFLHKANYLRHIQRHEAPGGFICSLCQQPFTTEWDRNKHKREAHSVFRCRLCKEEFPVEDDYNAHIQNEHAGRDREYDVCPTCGQQFRSASQLKVHIDSNCGKEKKHECAECQSRYLTQASLNAHMIKHLGEKSHLCDYCGASFLNKGQLKVHERMHTGERPYKCNQCDKAFAHRESLITHSTTHTGIKPYYCSYCQSRFSCIGNLLKHRRARSDTCGLPQYCQTNKIVARPNIKTMPNLTDRQVYTHKVVQRSGPPRNRKRKAESPEPQPKASGKRTGKKPATSFHSAEKQRNVNDNASFEAENPKQSDAKKKNTKQEVVSPKKHFQKLVDLKVEPGDGFSVEVETKPEDTLDEEEVVIVDEIAAFEVKIEDEEEEIILEYETIEEIDNGKEKVGVQKPQKSDEDKWNDYVEGIESYEDDDDSEDYQPRKTEPIVRKVFDFKPPVVTSRRRRGRPKKEIIPPKHDLENIILIDVEQKNRELEAQRVVFDYNIQVISIDCFQCSHCPSQYTSEYLIGRHLERDHGIMLKELLETLQYGKVCAREKRFQCRHCERLYANEKVLEKHILLHGPDNSFIHKCPCCTTYYATEEEAREHAMDKHRWRLECSICQKVFKEPEGLVNHNKYFHQGFKSHKKGCYVCPKCGKNFSSRTAVTDHERANCGQDPLYQCDICKKCLHSASSLKNHYTVHSDELPFSCQYCGKSYRTAGQVKVHERCHTGEKPYSCEFCPKTFGHRESLHTHRSLHTGIKRYMCSGCGMRFTCVSNLQAHKRSHKTTCGTVPNASKIVGPPGSGYHELPEGYELPYPMMDSSS